MTTETKFINFEAFWQERSPILMAQIKSEFLRFAEMQIVREQIVADEHTSSNSSVDLKQNSTVPTKLFSSVPSMAPREQLFTELVNIYAEAMEYPAEIFSEAIELEAELGIDSVKQTEIISRISSQYHLPPLPANFRSGDFKTMGQIVDYVYEHQGKAAALAAA